MCEKRTETHADSQHVDPNVAAALERAKRRVGGARSIIVVVVVVGSLDHPTDFNTSCDVTEGMA